MFFPNSEVIGFDYRSQTLWEAKKEFLAFFTAQRSRFEHVTLVANSIGAFFGLSSLDETLVDRAYLISPIVDMEKLICDMMQWSGGDRTGTCRETGNHHRFRRDAVLGVSVLCSDASDHLECPPLVFCTANMTT